MCSIAGRVELGISLAGEVANIEKMNAAMRHRGPDDAGVVVFDRALLGHNRLSVIDTTARGHQPMVRTSLRGEGRLGLVFNGEIYNAPELRTTLRKEGYAFEGKSDTEVVIYAYDHWGKNAFKKFRGMFAIAIWDDSEQKLIMARDHTGQKPLHYYPTEGGVIFASEAGGLLEHPDVEHSIGIHGLQENFTFFKTPGAVIWNKMHEVKPRTIVTVFKRGNERIIEEEPYWQLQSRRHEDNYDETVTNVRDLTKGAVREQLVADRPVSTLLSGGLDSGIVSAVAASFLAEDDRKLMAFIMDYIDHAKYLKHAEVQTELDLPYALKVADMWGIDLKQILLDPTMLANPKLRRRIVRARGMSMGYGDHDISHLLLYDEISKKSTVALGGEMADEAFGGYDVFYTDEVLRGRGLSWDLLFPTVIPDRLAMLNPKVRKSLRLDEFLKERFTDMISQITPVSGESSEEHRKREITYENIMRHGSFLHDINDRFSMAAGRNRRSLELRSPFADHRLLEYAFNIPWHMKTSGGRRKGILRDAFSDMLPQSVTEREHSGYPYVPNPQYRRELQTQVQVLLANKNHPIFEIMSYSWLKNASQKPVDKVTISDRFGLNYALEMAVLIDLYNPTFITS